MTTSPPPTVPPPAVQPTLKPGVGVTIYGNLPRDINPGIVAACDFVTLHTAADDTDITSAMKVRSMGCSRVWLAVPANYFVRLAASKGRDAAVKEARRCARIAAGMNAEVFEFNGEGSSDGSVPGDWVPADDREAALLSDLAGAIIEAARDELKATTCLVSWTSHDMPSFKLPWRAIMRRVQVHSPQHYPAQKGRWVSQVELAARIARSAGRWEALADRGDIPHAVVPIEGAAWVPYLQGWGHQPQALCAELSEAPVTRLWAFPGSWDDKGLQGLYMATALRRLVGPGPGAVKRFQAQHGLEDDGIIGRKTTDALALFILAR